MNKRQIERYILDSMDEINTTYQEDTDKNISKAIECAKCFGLSVENISIDNPVAWNGLDMTIRVIMPFEGSYSNIFHEIGHFIVSSIERRQFTNYGLGPSTDDCDYNESEILDFVDLNKEFDEESNASVMGILLEIYFNINTEATLSNHSWLSITTNPYFDSKSCLQSKSGTYYLGDKNIFKIIKYLIKKNLITKNLEPTFKINMELD